MHDSPTPTTSSMVQYSTVHCIARIRCIFCSGTCTLVSTTTCTSAVCTESDFRLALAHHQIESSEAELHSGLQHSDQIHLRNNIDIDTAQGWFGCHVEVSNYTEHFFNAQLNRQLYSQSRFQIRLADDASLVKSLQRTINSVPVDVLSLIHHTKGQACRGARCKQ